MEPTDSTSSSASSNPPQMPRPPETTPSSSTTQRTHETATKTINNSPDISPRADNQGNQTLQTSTVVSSTAPPLIQENAHKQSHQQGAHWPTQLQTDEQLEDARLDEEIDKAKLIARQNMAEHIEHLRHIDCERDYVIEKNKKPIKSNPFDYKATYIAGIALIALATLYGCYRFRSFPDRFINQLIRN